MSFTITSDVRKPAACCDSSSTRYALGQVKAFPNCDGIWLASTDSRVAAVSHAEIEGELERTLLPETAFPKRKTNGRKAVTVSPEEWRNNEEKFGKLEPEETLGRFPSIDYVLPEIDKQDGLCVSIDVEHVLKVAEAIQKRDEKILTLHFRADQFSDGSHGELAREYQGPIVSSPRGSATTKRARTKTSG